LSQENLIFSFAGKKVSGTSSTFFRRENILFSPSDTMQPLRFVFGFWLLDKIPISTQEPSAIPWKINQKGFPQVLGEWL